MFLPLRCRWRSSLLSRRARPRAGAKLRRFRRRAVAGRAGQGRHARDLRSRHARRHARSARHRRHQAPAGIRQAGRRLHQFGGLARPHRPRQGQGERMGEDLRRGGEEIRRRALGAGRAVGHGNRLRRRERPLGRVPLAGDARLCEIPRSLFSQRADRRHAHHAGRSFRPRTMVSSWAGAMGQTQFMPTNVIDFAIDFSGDGKSDIWTNVPDVLASTGNYLHKGHWKYGLPWGFEVIVPKGFDYHARATRASPTGKSSASAAPTARPFPPRGQRHSLLPGRRKRTGFHRHGQLRRAQGVQQLRRLCDRRRPSRRPHAGRRADQGRRGRATIIRCRATRASRCRKSSQRSATRSPTSKATSISICATISAPSRKIRHDPGR